MDTERLAGVGVEGDPKGDTSMARSGFRCAICWIMTSFCVGRVTETWRYFSYHLGFEFGSET